MELGHALQVITELLALHSVSSFLHPTLGVPVGVELAPTVRISTGKRAGLTEKARSNLVAV